MILCALHVLVHIFKFYNFEVEKHRLETSYKKTTSHNPEINRYYFAILTKCFRRKHLATKGLLSLCTHSLRNHNVIQNGVKDLLIIHSLCTLLVYSLHWLLVRSSFCLFVLILPRSHGSPGLLVSLQQRNVMLSLSKHLLAAHSLRSLLTHRAARFSFSNKAMSC